MHAAEGWTAGHWQDRARSTHSLAEREPALRTRGLRQPQHHGERRAELSGSREHARRGSGPALHLHLHAAAGALRRGADCAARGQTRDAREAADGHHAADRAARRRSRAPRPHAVPDLALAMRRGRRRRARVPAHPQARRAAGSSGRKTCTTGIPASAGSGSQVASASSIRASTRCRCSPKSCRTKCASKAPLLEFPENQQAPIAADAARCARTTASRSAPNSISGRRASRAGTSSSRRPPVRSSCAHGGAELSIDGRAITADASMAGEYPRLYQRFAALCDAGKSEVDWRPFQLVADAFLDRRTPHRRTSRNLGRLMNARCIMGPAVSATVRIPGALGDPHRSESRLGLPHRGGHRRSCRGLGWHGSAGHAQRRCAAHLESRRCRLRISRHGLVLPAVRAAQTTRGRNRAAALRRHVLQGARVGEWRRGGRTRGRLYRAIPST